MSVVDLARRIRAGEVSPREAVQSYLDRIERLDGEINAYISVRAEEALAEADAPQPGPLSGVPVAIKDVIDVAGAETTAASKVLRRVPERDAACVERLRHAGAIVLGKLNTHEFAFGAMTTSQHFGPAHNPWSLDRICGGSSGGSGAAAAADLAAGTLGTDTAGSIRIPACLCGVTGVQTVDRTRSQRRTRACLVVARHDRPARTLRRRLRAPALGDRGATPTTWLETSTGSASGPSRRCSIVPSPRSRRPHGRPSMSFARSARWSSGSRFRCSRRPARSCS